MDLAKVLGARIVAGVETLSIADIITSKPDFRDQYRATFSPIVAGNVKDYEGELEWDAAQVTPVELTLEQKKAFAFGIDDVDALKTTPERIERLAFKQARGLTIEEDKFLLKTLASKAGKQITRTIGQPKDAYEALVDANKELSIADAPFHDRFLIIDHVTLGMLEKDDRFTRDYKILSNGLLEGADINGAYLIVTNNLPENTILAVQRDGVGFDRFLDKVEILRLESSFSDGFRGLTVFDGVVLEKECIVKVSTKEPATKKDEPKA